MEIIDRRIVLVTGATRGLGAEVAARLAQRSHFVLVAGRTRAAAEGVAETIRRTGGTARALALDVTDESSIAGAVREVQEGTGRLDVLVNNAGVMRDGSWSGNTATSIEPALLRATFETNFFAVVRVTQAFLPLLRRGRDAHVINVSSAMGSTSLHADFENAYAGAKPFAYDSSKAALNSFTVHLAAALAGEGIRVNSVHPGWVRTELGTDAATLGVSEGALPIVELAASVGARQTGKFVQAGGELPW